MSYKPGSVIGDYVVVATVGAGGMGSVYKVQHVITQRIEAIKLLSSVRTDPEQEQRFIREMQVQARLHHPNIAAVYNAFRYYDEFFLVLEFVDGESLESVLARGRLTLATSLHYARQALFALGYAHAHGVVHRDIAPSNIIITPDGAVKLTDFGLAKTATDVRLTHSGAPLGSPWYMSPEQVRGNATLDARSDIYSLGAVLYEMATGTKPFDMASTFDVMRAQVETPPMPPLGRAPDLPQALNDIILAALAKDPSARFQSAEQFYAALESLQTAAAPVAVRAAAPSSAPAAPVMAPGQRARRSRMPRWFANPLVQAGLGSAACGLVLFGGYTAYSMARVASAAPPPVIQPVKATIPPPPDFLLPAEPVAPAAAATAEPPAEASPPAEPHKVHKVTAHLAAPADFVPQATREFSVPPDRTVAPAAQSAKPRADRAQPTALLAEPALPKPPAIAAPVPQEDPVDLPAITAPTEPAPKEKKGNRFLRALHRAFHKDESAEPATTPADSSSPNDQ